MPVGAIGAGFLAGILSTLSPCIFPLLPLVVGAATSTRKSGAFWLAGGVAAAFTIAGLFIGTVGFAIGLDGEVFRAASAALLIVFGIALLSTAVQARLGLAAGAFGAAADRIMGRLALATGKGQFLVGVLLGLVWSPCAGPTLGAASLLAAQDKDIGAIALVMLAFGIGSTLPMLIVALLSRQALLRWRGQLLAAGHLGKVALSVSALAIGGLVLTGADRGVEAALVKASPAWLTDLTTEF
jgi:cytochrome c-type biogenesis protein